MIETTSETCPRCGDAVLAAPMHIDSDPATGYQCGSGPCDWFVVRPEGNDMPLKDLLAAAVGVAA